MASEAFASNRASLRMDWSSALAKNFDPDAGTQITVVSPSPGVLELRVCSPVRMDASFFTASNQLTAVLE